MPLRVSVTRHERHVSVGHKLPRQPTAERRGGPDLGRQRGGERATEVPCLPHGRVPGGQDIPGQPIPHLGIYEHLRRIFRYIIIFQWSTDCSVI